uniref:Small heat shock protein OV25-1 n=1 Tax=Ascaris suum TaxID=6253 RepID=F1L8F5_ASCSU
MLLYPYSRPHYHVRTVPEHPVARVFDSALQDMDRSLRVLVPLIEHVSQQDIKGDNAVASLFSDKEKIAIELDVSQFRPEELSVNLRDHELVIEGHHEERSDDYGSIERHFVRKYSLPENTKLDTIESHLSDKGVLSISANKVTSEEAPAKSVPIQSVPEQQKTRKNNDKKP